MSCVYKDLDKYYLDTFIIDKIDSNLYSILCLLTIPKMKSNFILSYFNKLVLTLEPDIRLSYMRYFVNY